MDEHQFQAPVIGWLGAEAPRTSDLKIGFSSDDLTAFSGAPLDYRNHGPDTAHILFTSGSTGAPKGVQITHDNALRFIEWATRYFGACAEDRISGHPPLHFDLSTFDIYATLGAVAQLHLVPAELNLLLNKIADFIRRHELTQWFSALPMGPKLTIEYTKPAIWRKSAPTGCFISSDGLIHKSKAGATASSWAKLKRH